MWCCKPKKESRPDAPSLPVITVSPVQNQRVLVCDDAQGNRTVLTRYMESFGCAVDTACNGKDALDVIEANGEYAIVWMDVKMPHMNGIDCTRALRQSGYRGAIIGITGFVDTDLRQQCFDAGMTHVTTKPVDKEVLKMYVDKYAAA